MIEWEASLSLSEELAVARLHDLTTQLISCEDVQSAVNITMDAAIELHQADFGTFQVLRSESHDLEIVAQRGFKEDFLEAFRSVSADDPCACGRALRDQKPIIIKDVIKDNEFTPYREIALEAEYRAVVAMPMVSGDGEFSGVLSTHFRKPRIPSSPQLHVGTLYARQAAEILARLKREQALTISRNKQTLAAKELSHRVKNVLTMVQALSRESMKGATGLSEYAEAFEARIKALAHAHEALSESDWRLGRAIRKGETMSATTLLVILIVGLIAGWSAGQIVRGTGFGLVADIAIGIVGALIGSWLLPRLGIHLGSGIVPAIIGATIGAIILLLILRLVYRRGRW